MFSDDRLIDVIIKPERINMIDMKDVIIPLSIDDSLYVVSLTTFDIYEILPNENKREYVCNIPKLCSLGGHNITGGTPALPYGVKEGEYITFFYNEGYLYGLVFDLNNSSQKIFKNCLTLDKYCRAGGVCHRWGEYYVSLGHDIVPFYEINS